MLTAKEMQDLLQVDRSSIYRMAEAGRLPAVKVGKQWRFPDDQINYWLSSQAALPTLPAPTTAKPAPEPSGENSFAGLLPLACVQLIQDTFAAALGVMVVITDIEGKPVTQFSHPCGLFNVVNQTPGALQKCVESWHKLGQTLELEPKFTPSHLGLLCARALVRVGTELKGMVVVGGIAPEHWPPSAETVQAIATEFGVQPEVMIPHLAEVFYLNKAEQIKVLTLLQQIANVVAHIINERTTLLKK